MKRAVLTVGVAVFLATPAAAQWLGQPIWNNPMGATGITIYGDYGKPNTDAGQGSAVGGRVALASGSVTLTLGVASWKPQAFSFCSVPIDQPHNLGLHHFHEHCRWSG